jgi:hypothetical protein
MLHAYQNPGTTTVLCYKSITVLKPVFGRLAVGDLADGHLTERTNLHIK